jgi:hypothetical protein
MTNVFIRYAFYSHLYDQRLYMGYLLLPFLINVLLYLKNLVPIMRRMFWSVTGPSLFVQDAHSQSLQNIQVLLYPKNSFPNFIFPSVTPISLSPVLSPERHPEPIE